MSALIAGALSCATGTAAPVQTDLQIARVVPDGPAPASQRQIVVTFDRPVVALGEMGVGAQSPVTVKPSLDCHWHWLDPRSLGCELDASTGLAAATEYTVSVKGGLRAQDGTQLAADYRWTFTTERPAVKEFSFRTWRAPGTPVVRLVFNQPVTRESVRSRLHFGSQAGVLAEADPEVAEVRGQGGPQEARRVWLVSPPAELPADAHVALLITPGLRAPDAPLAGAEARTVVEFDTFPEFRFLGVRCSAGEKSVLLTPAPLPAAPACNPFATVSLVFSAPVTASEIKAHLELKPDLAAGRSDYDPWANVYPGSELESPHQRGAEYAVDLPEHLRAFTGYSMAGLGAVHDEFGRLQSGMDGMSWRTAHRPPRLKLTHPVAVLEKNAPTSLPLYVTNLTHIDIHYHTLTPQGASGALTDTQPVDRVWDTAYATPARIRPLLGGGSGVVSGSFHPHPTPGRAGEAGADEEEDDPGVPRGRRDRDFFAEVTPFQVHVKLGHFNTLVWVTSLSTGLPIADARIRVFRDDYQGLTGGLTAAADVLGEGRTDADGIAMLAGRAILEPAESPPAADGRSLMVRVDAAGDLALLPLDDSFEIDTYRASRGTFWSAYSPDRTHVRAWGATAQGVYKLGDLVQYKVYLRHENNLSLEAVTRRAGYRLEVVDPTGKTVHSQEDLGLSEFGALAGSFRVPPTAAVGWYEFRVGVPGAPTLTAMRVLIADFTPAPFQVQTTLNGQAFSPGDAVEVSTKATLHAGGPYAGAAARVTARLFPQPVEVPAAAAAGFEFASVIPVGDCASQPWPEVMTVHQSDASVDDKGELTTRFPLPDAGMLSARLEVESAVRDERGKYVASHGGAGFHGRDRFVGLRATSWTFEEGKPATMQYLVVDAAGNIVRGVPVNITARVQSVNAARVKGAGSAYLTSYDTHWENQAGCSGASADDPRDCTFTPGRPGLYSITAHILDAQGRPHATEACVWVTGKGHVLWQEPADMSLTLLPEKNAYQVGDRARYLVKNPFPGARALITIERAGIIKRWTQTLEGNTPVIEFAVEPDFLPGFYLSVVVVSPRVAPVPGAAPLDKDGVDLGRPTYRMGYVKVPVQDPYKMLDVTLKPDRGSYKPRDIVHIDMAAVPHRPWATHDPLEFAVVVLDEAVFDLIQDGKGYFDPYRGLYRFENLDLVNYTLLSRLIGLQKFEKKGANSGGDGGAGFDMRSISQYVAYWNPSVPADAAGRAAVSFALPDNLTGWRVFAIAVTPGDRMGLGDAKFVSSKLTELRPVMPNQLTAGDVFDAGFSVLNRSDKSRTVAVDVEATGPIAGGAASTHKSLRLGPFKRDTVWLHVTTVGDGGIRFTARTGDRFDRDALSHRIEVHRRTSLDVAASYGSSDGARVEEPVRFPDAMRAGAGDLSLTLTPTVLGNVDGALRYVRDYPYLCWEQRLTKALLAASYLRLRDHLAADLDWPDAKSLPQTLLDDAATFQAPNGGMGFWSAQDERVSPYLSAATALGFNRLRAAGYRVPGDVQTKLDGYLGRLLREDAAPTFYTAGMVSSVRAVALQALAERGKLTLADLQRYESAAPQMDLFGLAAYLDAAVRVQGAEPLAASLTQQILAHANQSGGQFHFSEPWDDGYSQMLASPLRSESRHPHGLRPLWGDHRRPPVGGRRTPQAGAHHHPQTRGGRDHWENTQENLYCTSALGEYASVYEQTTPALQIHASLEGGGFAGTAVGGGAAAFTSLRDAPVVLTRATVQMPAAGRRCASILKAGGGSTTRRA